MIFLHFITPALTKELIGIFIMYWTLTRILYAAATYRLRISTKEKDIQIATKNFYFIKFFNKIILAIPLLLLALKIIIS